MISLIFREWLRQCTDCRMTFQGYDGDFDNGCYRCGGRKPVVVNGHLHQRRKRLVLTHRRRDNR